WRSRCTTQCGRPAARCRDCSWSVSAGRRPEPAVRVSPQRALRVSCPLLAADGGGRVRGPWGGDARTAVAVAFDGDAGCATEDHPVVGEPPALVAEPAADLPPADAPVFAAQPAGYPPPGVVVDPAEHLLGHAVTEVVRPPLQGPVQ